MKAYLSIGLVLDVLGMLALAGTSEVHLAVFYLPALFLLVQPRTRFRLKDSFVFLCFVLFFILSGWITFSKHWHPILVVSHTLPIIHSILWFCDKTFRWQNWRLAISFVEIVLAAALSPDLYMSVIIFCFIAGAFFYLTESFVNNWFKIHSTQSSSSRVTSRQFMPSQVLYSQSSRQMKRSLFKVNLVFLFFTIVLGLLLFPFIPRTHTELSTSSFKDAKVGYTEEVDVSSWLKSTNDSGRPILRVSLAQNSNHKFSSTAAVLDDALYKGLIRGRTLDRFDGQKWTTLPLNKRLKQFSVRKVTHLKATNLDSMNLEIIREPLETDHLPAPYGTTRIKTEASFGSYFSQMYPTLEWSEPSFHGRRVRYQVFLSQDRSTIPVSLMPQDHPLHEHLDVPVSHKNGSIARLANRLFSTSQSIEQKISSLNKYFIENRFGVLTVESFVQINEAKNKLKLSPLEQFLFVEKEGHCELFASSYALLLRMAGVPTRLIAGFRVSRYPTGDTLIVQSSDAHAWLEYWNPSTGWNILDPTPRVIRKDKWSDYFRAPYDLINTFWLKYVVANESLTKSEVFKSSPFAKLNLTQGQADRAPAFTKSESYQRMVLYVVFGLVFLIFVTFFRKFAFKPYSNIKVNKYYLKLTQERTRLERWLYKHLRNEKARFDMNSNATLLEMAGLVDQKWGKSVTQSFMEWVDYYHQLRYNNPAAIDRDAFNKLKTLKKRFLEKVRSNRKN